jgi:ribosomal 50S subunit-associated protein YjgA (DUF615 family)
MGEREGRQGFRIRLEAVERALARLADDPLRHRKMIEELEELRGQYLAELDRSVPEDSSTRGCVNERR